MLNKNDESARFLTGIKKLELKTNITCCINHTTICFLERYQGCFLLSSDRNPLVIHSVFLILGN